jgi:hypothetical protein
MKPVSLPALAIAATTMVNGTVLAQSVDLSVLAPYVKHGKLDAARLQRDYDGQNKAREKADQKHGSSRPAIDHAIRHEEALAESDRSNGRIDCAEDKPTGPFRCLVRHDFSDVFLFQRPTKRSDAQALSSPFYATASSAIVCGRFTV